MAIETEVNEKVLDEVRYLLLEILRFVDGEITVRGLLNSIGIAVKGLRDEVDRQIAESAADIDDGRLSSLIGEDGATQLLQTLMRYIGEPNVESVRERLAADITEALDETMDGRIGTPSIRGNIDVNITCGSISDGATTPHGDIYNRDTVNDEVELIESILNDTHDHIRSTDPRYGVDE
jgi:hypothetical protein